MSLYLLGKVWLSNIFIFPLFDITEFYYHDAEWSCLGLETCVKLLLSLLTREQSVGVRNY